MNFYDIIMTPLEKNVLGTIRKELLTQAKGKVLELGIGSGANIPYYNLEKVSHITGTDIKDSPPIDKKRLKNIEYISCSAEKLPFADNSFDTVVSTLVLCSVPEVETALAEIKRVLAPKGKYLFIEHVRPHKRLGTAADIANGLWKHLAHGCNLNKKTYDLIDKAGFRAVNAQRNSSGILYYGLAEI